MNINYETGFLNSTGNFSRQSHCHKDPESNILFFQDAIDDCEELESEFAEFFDYLNSVADLDTHSLGRLAEKAASEGEKYLKWKTSGCHLNKVGLFYKFGDKSFPIIKSLEFFKTTSFEIKDFEMRNNFQIEVWCLDDDEHPYCVLVRLSFSELVKTGKIKLVEELRKGLFLKLNAVLVDGRLSMRISQSPFKNPFSKKLLNSFKKFKKSFMNTIEIFFISNSGSNILPNVRDCEKIYSIADFYRPPLLGMC